MGRGDQTGLMSDFAGARPTAHPHSPQMVEETLHPPGHVDEACGRADDDCVVVGKFLGPCDRRGLVGSAAYPANRVVAQRSGHSPDCNLRPGNLARAVVLCAGNAFEMTEHALMENDDFRHGNLALSRCVRTKMRGGGMACYRPRGEPWLRRKE